MGSTKSRPLGGGGFARVSSSTSSNGGVGLRTPTLGSPWRIFRPVRMSLMLLKIGTCFIYFHPFGFFFLFLVFRVCLAAEKIACILLLCHCGGV